MSCCAGQSFRTVYDVSKNESRCLNKSRVANLSLFASFQSYLLLPLLLPAFHLTWRGFAHLLPIRRYLSRGTGCLEIFAANFTHSTQSRLCPFPDGSSTWWMGTLCNDWRMRSSGTGIFAKTMWAKDAWLLRQIADPGAIVGPGLSWYAISALERNFHVVLRHCGLRR